MAITDFKRLGGEALLATAPMASDEALALASGPGGCEGKRFPLFVELEAQAAGAFALGGFASVEFILPGKPGRWKAAGQITLLVNSPRPDAPFGIGVELLGLALAGGAEAPTAEAEAEPEAEVEVFDPSAMVIELDDVAGMLGDLLGRDVECSESTVLQDKIKPFDIIAGFRDDAGEMIFVIAFDKAGAARIGGSLTMMPEAGLADDIKGRSALEGEPLENAGEVLNIMSALFHEADSPHVVLAETVRGEELPDGAGGDIQAVLDSNAWSLCLTAEIEDYGAGEILLIAK